MANQAEVDRILLTVDNETLEEDDWGNIIDEVSQCAAKWKPISGRLGIPPKRLTSIQSENPGSDVNCWNTALQEWLGQNYNTSKYPLPSWRVLLRAIAREEYAVFKKLAAAHPETSGESGITAPPPSKGASGQKRRMTDKIVSVNQLTSLKYTKDGKEVTVDIIQRAAHRWTNISDRVAEDHNVVDNLRELYRGKTDQALRKVLIDHFIDNKPVGGYSQDWSGLVQLLNDVRLGNLASEIEEAVTSG